MAASTQLVYRLSVVIWFSHVILMSSLSYFYVYRMQKFKNSTKRIAHYQRANSLKNHPSEIFSISEKLFCFSSFKLFSLGKPEESGFFRLREWEFVYSMRARRYIFTTNYVSRVALVNKNMRSTLSHIPCISIFATWSDGGNGSTTVIFIWQNNRFKHARGPKQITDLNFIYISDWRLSACAR